MSLIATFPCNMGDPTNWQTRGYHRFAANRNGIIVCEFCGEAPAPRPAPEPHRFGLNHPLWNRPECFYYDSAEEARERAVATYGEESGHVVVEIVEIHR